MDDSTAEICGVYTTSQPHWTRSEMTYANADLSDSSSDNPQKGESSRADVRGGNKVHHESWDIERNLVTKDICEVQIPIVGLCVVYPWAKVRHNRAKSRKKTGTQTAYSYMMVIVWSARTQNGLKDICLSDLGSRHYRSGESEMGEKPLRSNMDEDARTIEVTCSSPAPMLEDCRFAKNSRTNVGEYEQ